MTKEKADGDNNHILPKLAEMITLLLKYPFLIM